MDGEEGDMACKDHVTLPLGGKWEEKVRSIERDVSILCTVWKVGARWWVTAPAPGVRTSCESACRAILRGMSVVMAGEHITR